MNQKFTDVDNSSPVVDLLDRKKKVFPRSKFDFSNSKILQAQFGAIIPIDCINTLPNEDYTIGYDILALTRNPAVRRVLSGCRLYVHTFYQPESNLWEGALNQKTGGRSGNITLEKPYFLYKPKGTVGEGESAVDVTLDFRTPNSLCDYLGLPIVRYDNSDGSKPLLSFVPTSTSSAQVNPDYACKVDALRFVMYQRFCRDMMFNGNLLYNNKELYPDNEYHFILPYGATEVSCLSYDNPNTLPESLFTDYADQETFASGKYFVPENNNDTPVLLGALRFRQFRGDVFTSALPFPDLLRGDVPVLDFQSINAVSDTDLVSSIQGEYRATSAVLPTDKDFYLGTYNGSSVKGYLKARAVSEDAAKGILDIFKVKVSDIASKLVGQNVSLSDLRALMVYTLIKQKNALTSGDYNDLVKAHFGVSPRVRNFEHTYIGGFYADLVYNEVFQTSASDTTPLGTTASRGVTAQSGYIGKFHSDDYGYIMTCLEIVPEVYYHQGLDRNLTKLTREEVYLPETNELSPQAILNQEIFATDDEIYNKDVFGYTERNIEYKYRQNEVHGLSALGSFAEYDNALLQKRTFSNKVYLNNDFVTMSPKNIDMSIFSFTDEPPFDIVVKSRIEKVSPIPYVSIPGGLDLSLT